MPISDFGLQCITCRCNYTILPLEQQQQLCSECNIVGNRTSFSFISPVIYDTELTELPWPGWLRTFINNNKFYICFITSEWPLTSREGATGHLDQKTSLFIQICIYKWFIHTVIIFQKIRGQAVCWSIKQERARVNLGEDKHKPEIFCGTLFLLAKH